MSTALFEGFIQHAYVTNDLDRGIAEFSRSYGLSKFLPTRSIPYGPECRLQLALAYAGNVMVELIQPEGDIPLYQCMLPGDGFAIRFHHLGHFLRSEAQWEDILAAVRASGIPIAVQGESNGLKYLYVDARASIGHFLEYIYCSTPESSAMFDNVPHN